jgi:transcriptional regulator with XRE-family HTH domain
MPRARRKEYFPTVADLGKRLRARRHELGLTQRDVAETAGLHPTAIGLIERADRDPRWYTLMRVIDALDIDPGDLLRGLRLKG